MEFEEAQRSLEKSLTRSRELRDQNVHLHRPSTKYGAIEDPSNVIIQRAQSPPRPTLPRQSHVRSWSSQARERYPLSSSLSGPARAGKLGELIGKAGSRYTGEVLAGRPCGEGQFWVPRDDGSGEYVLQYEGGWVQGRREGYGIRYYANGEVYSGEFRADARHGQGLMEYANGEKYQGDWVDDQPHGKGTFHYPSGDFFVGTFMRSKKEGMGTLFMLKKRKKYTAEYISGEPRCGTYMEIEDGDIEPLDMGLRNTISKLTDSLPRDSEPEQPTAALPELDIKMPFKVLNREIVTVRDHRKHGPAPLRASGVELGTLDGSELRMLYHSFVQMSGGDGEEASLIPSQLRELCVLAGLDPAAQRTAELVDALLEERAKAANGKISLNAFLRVLDHFRETAATADAGVDDDDRIEYHGGNRGEMA